MSRNGVAEFEGSIFNSITKKSILYNIEDDLFPTEGSNKLHVIKLDKKSYILKSPKQFKIDKR